MDWSSFFIGASAGALLMAGVLFVIVCRCGDGDAQLDADRRAQHERPTE